MPQFQQLTIIGHLGRDPETRYLPNGDPVCNFSVAVGEQWTDKNSGEKKEHTEWFRCNAFKKLAEVADKYLKKGNPVFVQGRLKTRKWQDKDGHDRYSTELHVERIQLLGGRPSSATEPDDIGDQPTISTPSQASAPKANPRKGGFDDLEDDIPF